MQISWFFSAMIASTLRNIKIISCLSSTTVGFRLSVMVPRFFIINVMVTPATTSATSCDFWFFWLMLSFTHRRVSSHWLASASLLRWRSESLLNIEFLLELFLLFSFDCHFHVVIVTSLRSRCTSSSHSTSPLFFNCLFRFFSLFFWLFRLWFWS